MALPLLLWGAAAALGSYGVKKGFDAKSDNDKAKRIGERAERQHRRALSDLEQHKAKTNLVLEQLGQYKAHVFVNQIKQLIDVVKKNKSASSRLKDFNEGFSDSELVSIEHNIETSLELSKGLGVGAVSGALAAYGAYSGVGALAAASTGTAISGLSGVAATNATLAWLGGGSLASGGMGIAGGTAVLGGLVIAPALAIGGFMMASKAEEALTKAREYEADIEIAIAQIEASGAILDAVQDNARQLAMAIRKMTEVFDHVYVDNMENINAFQKMLAVGLSLKQLLETPVMDKEGQAIPHFATHISGYLEH